MLDEVRMLLRVVRMLAAKNDWMMLNRMDAINNCEDVGNTGKDALGRIKFKTTIVGCVYAGKCQVYV